MIKRLISTQSFAVVLVMLLLVLILSMGINKTGAQTSVIPASLALDRALTFARDDGWVGGAVAQPAEARGQAMTYGQAVELIFGRPIDPNDSIYKNRDLQVWVVVLHGKFIEHVPSSADGSIPAKDVVHNQMVIILDGNTGEIMERVMISPQKVLSVANLPILSKSAEPLPPLPTKGPISTEVPYPTLVSP